MNRDSTGSGTFQARVLAAVRRPRVTLFILAGWSVLALLTQIFVNSPLFLDIHDAELDGALGGLALSFNAVPLAVLYVYCARDPSRYHAVFWIALVQQGAMVAGNLYELVIGTYSVESVIIPLVGAFALGALSFAQVFEPRPINGGGSA